MRVEALSELSCGWLPWTNASGQSFATVVAKMTFDVGASQISLSSAQEDILAADRHYDDDPNRSVYAPADLVPFKARVDVLLVGHAYAANQQAVRTVRTRVAVRECDKAIEVYGDRAWGMDGEMREGPRFLKMPLRWERAAGGPYTLNPIGIRSDVSDSLGRVLLPNLQLPGKHIDKRGDAIDSVGFGPIAASWPARRPLGEAVAAGRIGQAEPSYFNSAPSDQQLSELADDDPIILENLHPTASLVSARLPGVRPRAFLDGGETGTEVPLRCDTLWIECDRALLTLTWRGRLPLDNLGAGATVWIATERKGSPLTWATILRLREVPPESDDAGPSSVTHVPTTKEPVAKGAEGLPFDRQVARTQPRGEKHVEPAAPPWMQRVSGAPSPLAQLASQTPLQSSHTVSMPSFGSTPPPANAHGSPSSPPSPQLPAMVPPPGMAGGPVQTTPAMQSVPKPSGASAPPAMQPAPPAMQPAPPAMQPAQALTPPPAPAVQPPAPVRTASGYVPPGVALSQGPEPPPPPPVHAMKAALSGAASASDAAAQREQRPGGAARQEQRRARPASGEILELTWFSEEAAKRVRANPAFAEAIRDKSSDEWVGAEGGAETKDAVRDRKDVVRAMMRAPRTETEELSTVLAEAVDEDGVLVPPTVVMAGEMALQFSVVERLKATVAVVSPFAPADKRLTELCEQATALLGSDFKCTTAAAEALVQKLREAFGGQARGVPPGFLDDGVERILLEDRAYDRRTVLGKACLRATLSLSGGGAVATYLPDHLATELPMYQRFRAAAVGELRTQQDQFESAALAFMVMALGRLVTAARGA